jgi:hypothetical protein
MINGIDDKVHTPLEALDKQLQPNRTDRRVGLIEDMPDDLIDAVLNAKVPDEFAYLDELLKSK